MTKILFFDIDNTLLDFALCSREAMEESFAEWGLEFASPMFEVFTTVNDGLWQQVERGELTVEKLWKIRWNLIFDRIGICGDGEKFEKLFHSKLEKSHIPVSGAKEILETLAGRYRLFAASNAPSGQQEYRLEKAGMLGYFEGLFISGEIGETKPSRAFFDKCISLSGGKRDEIMMIGDSLSADIAGAMNAGIGSCWFNPHGKPLTGEYVPDRIISSLAELGNIMQKTVDS